MFSSPSALKTDHPPGREGSAGSPGNQARRGPGHICFHAASSAGRSAKDLAHGLPGSQEP